MNNKTSPTQRRSFNTIKTLLPDPSPKDPEIVRTRLTYHNKDILIRRDKKISLRLGQISQSGIKP